jgi:hypothetical protein
MVVEVSNEDERLALAKLLQLLRDVGSQSVITVVRENNDLRFWFNGRTAGRLRLANALPAWREREGLQGR